MAYCPLDGSVIDFVRSSGHVAVPPTSDLRLNHLVPLLQPGSLAVTMAIVQFAPWSSDIDLAFYSALTSRKINHDKLDDAARKLVGRYEVRPFDPPERSARMQFHGNAFTVDEYVCGLSFDRPPSLTSSFAVCLLVSSAPMELLRT